MVVERARFLRGLRRWAGVALLVGGLQVVAPGAHAAAADCDDRSRRSEVPESGAIFNDPTGEDPEQYRILSAIVRNIHGTPPGGTVRVATLAIQAPSVVEALSLAHRCGVSVRVLVPGRAWEDNAVVTLRKALGTDTALDSYITQCDGTCTTDGSGGIMHVKTFLFSKVRGVGPVTVHSSANLTRGQATKRWNDAYQLVGDTVMYSAAVDFFDALVKDAEVDYPRLVKAAGHWQYSFPAVEDFHLGLLDATRCRSTLGPTQVRFSASIWKQVAVAEKLADLRDAGCDVRVLLNLDKIDRPVLETLHARGVPTRVQYGDDPNGAVHSKYVAIQGMHDGYVVRTVYSGSMNVSRFSGRTANNNMIRIVDDASVHAAYRRVFERVWELARPLQPSDIKAAGAVDARAAEMAD
jgi:hypothetical protein